MSEKTTQPETTPEVQDLQAQVVPEVAPENDNCKECNGTGRHLPEQTCPTCEGTGKK
jgi:DnaJ-class molecular chaperone